MITYEYCTTREPNSPYHYQADPTLLNTVCAALHFCSFGEDHGQRYWTIRRLESWPKRRSGWPDSVCSASSTSSHNHAMNLDRFASFVGSKRCCTLRLVRPTGQSPYITTPISDLAPLTGDIPDCQKAAHFTPDCQKAASPELYTKERPKARGYQLLRHSCNLPGGPKKTLPPQAPRHPTNPPQPENEERGGIVLEQTPQLCKTLAREAVLRYRNDFGGHGVIIMLATYSTDLPSALYTPTCA